MARITHYALRITPHNHLTQISHPLHSFRIVLSTLEYDHRQWWELNRDGIRLVVLWYFFRVDASGIADIAAAVVRGITIEQFLVKPRHGHAQAIAETRLRCTVAGANDHLLPRFAVAQE